MGFRELKVQVEKMEILESKGRVDFREFLDLLVLKANLEAEVKGALWELLDPKDFKESLEYRESLGSKERSAHLVKMV